MSLIINLIVGLIAFYFAYMYATRKPMLVKVPWYEGWKYECNQPLSFLIYSILTAMLFLGPLSLVKYGVWIVILLLMMYRGAFRYRFNMVLGAYTLFVLWNLYTMTYTPYPEQGWMMILKFCLPYLYFWLGYNAIQCEDDFYVFLEKTCWICCGYALIIGGVSAKFISPLYVFLNFTSGGLFVSYASLADFFAVLITVPITMYFATNKRKYLWMAAWMFLSTILESVRTGIGASVLGLSFFYMIYKKGKSIPYIGLMVILFITSIFAVPEVREKMFGSKANTVSVGSASMDQVEMNGRNFMWERIMEHSYYGHEMMGSGCGASLGWLKEKASKEGGIVLIHSDWVQMLSESGNIGLGFFVFFIIVLLWVILSETWKYKGFITITFVGAMTVASFVACFFAMGFDNVITYAQQGFVIPFIFLGLFYKIRTIETNYEQITKLQFFRKKQFEWLERYFNSACSFRS